MGRQRERGLPDDALAVTRLGQRLATLEPRLRRDAARRPCVTELLAAGPGADSAVELSTLMWITSLRNHSSFKVW